jgi:hypothetical protein
MPLLGNRFINCAFNKQRNGVFWLSVLRGYNWEDLFVSLLCKVVFIEKLAKSCCG